MGRGRISAALLAIASLLVAALPLALITASAAAAATPPFKIMPLGDSITRGNHDGNPAGQEGGYRNALENTLVNNGYSFDFVGTQTNGPSSLADKNHEGHPGYTIDAIRSEIFTYLAKDPDVVLLHLGTNDIGNDGTGLNTDTPIPDSDINTFIGKLSALVTTILNNSDATIIVAKITPWKIVSRADGNTACTPSSCISDYLKYKQDATRRYNDRIPSGLPSSSRIKVVDMFTNFSRTTWLDDDQHPNLTGYNQMAGRWYPVLKNVLDSFSTPVVNPPGAPTNVTATAGNGQATVTFTPPADNGGAAITSYRVESVPGGLNTTGSGSPLTVTGLTNGTSYQFKVRATNSAGPGNYSALSNAVTPTGTPPPAGTYLSDLNATSISGTFQKDKNAVGGPIALNGQSYAKGLGVNAISNVTYALNGQYKNFITDVGIDDSCTGTNKANIQIVADGQVLYPTSGTAIFTPSSPTLPLNLGVTGRNSLTLTASGAGDGTTCDRIDWANARLTTTSSATVPGAPTIGTATAGDTQATVRWTPPASNGGSTLTGYVVYIGDTTANPVKLVAGGATTQTDVTGLSNGTTYQFTVRAANSVGTGPASGLSNAVVPQAPIAPTVPDAPTIGTATAGNAQATVTFTPPANNGGASIIDYTVTSNPDGKTATGAGSPLTVTGLTNNQAYTFSVTARNSVGSSNPSSASNSVTPQPPTVPGAPTIGTATAGNGQATVTFTPPANNGGASITLYKVYANGGATAVAQGSASPINVPSLTNGQAYTFTVTATNSAGEGPPSNASNSVTPTNAPPVFISDLTPTKTGTGSFWKDKAINGAPLRLGSTTYLKGIQTSPTINLTYTLNGNYSRFQSDIGVDYTSCGGIGSVRFKVFLDGDLAADPAPYDSGTTAVKGSDPPRKIDLDVSGKTTMTLQLSLAGTSGCNYSDWANAKLVP